MRFGSGRNLEVRVNGEEGRHAVDRELLQKFPEKHEISRCQHGKQ